MTRLFPPAVRGALRYEVVMARRGRGAWLALAPLCVLMLLLAAGSPLLRQAGDGLARVGATATMVNLIGAVAVAVALADRLRAQCRGGLRELVDATPAPAGRVVGVLVGPWAAATAPVAGVLLLVGIWLSASGGSVVPVAGALVGVLTIVVPGTLLLTVTANVLALVVPVLVARLAVVLLWYWATAFTPLIRLPTPARTVLSPLGEYQASAWLGTQKPPWSGHDALTPPVGHASAALAVVVSASEVTVLFLAARVLSARRDDTIEEQT